MLLWGAHLADMVSEASYNHHTMKPSKPLIAFLLAKEDLSKKELELFKKLYKTKDVLLFIKHERDIAELFFRITNYGQAFEYNPEDPYKQTSLFPQND